MNKPNARSREAGKRAVILSSLYTQTTGQRHATQFPALKQLQQPSPTNFIKEMRDDRSPPVHTLRESVNEPGDLIPSWMKFVGLAFVIILVVVVFGPLSQQAARKVSTISGTSVASGRTALAGGAQTTSGHPKPPVLARAAYLLDATTGATLYASNAFAHLPILSTTKLMTALLAVEHSHLDQEITITPAIQNDLDTQLSPDSSLMGVKEGETYTLRELLSGLLLVSGNDAAIVIADAVSGNVSTFVALMNQRARALGMGNTHFANPHGLLDQSHYSCAHDMAILGKISLSQPAIHEISGMKELRLAATNGHHAYDMINGNQFLWWYPGVDGGKPGFDGVRNFNQVISCTRNGHHLIGVVLDTENWWTDMRDLMNWGFGTYQWISPADLVKTQFIPYASDWNYFTGDRKENTIPTADGRYYIATGFTVSGLILTFFDQNGGLSRFGFPTGMPGNSNRILVNQKFETATITCNTQTVQCYT